MSVFGKFTHMLHDNEREVLFDQLSKLYELIEQYASFETSRELRLDDSRVLETEGDDDIELSVHVD